tara:strand:+ start:4390 stop:4758 length:369 start_codon:yes stop_codon:yes gene_type:complete
MSAYQESVGLRISRQPGAVPTAAQIDEGQLAFNLADRRIFARFGEVIKDITDHYTQEEIDQALNGKVDAVEGMGLSERSYTQQEKTKLANVGSMANRNVYISAQPPDDAIGQDGDIWLQHWS